MTIYEVRNNEVVLQMRTWNEVRRERDEARRIAKALYPLVARIWGLERQAWLFDGIDSETAYREWQALLEEVERAEDAIECER